MGVMTGKSPVARSSGSLRLVGGIHNRHLPPAGAGEKFTLATARQQPGDNQVYER